MYYVGADSQIYDDGYDYSTAPAYGLDAEERRYELAPEYAEKLTLRFRADRSRLPLGNAVARVTGAFGVRVPCEPCERRKQALNRLGDRIAGFWSR